MGGRWRRPRRWRTMRLRGQPSSTIAAKMRSASMRSSASRCKLRTAERGGERLDDRGRRMGEPPPLASAQLPLWFFEEVNQYFSGAYKLYQAQTFPLPARFGGRSSYSDAHRARRDRAVYRHQRVPVGPSAKRKKLRL